MEYFDISDGLISTVTMASNVFIKDSKTYCSSLVMTLSMWTASESHVSLLMLKLTMNLQISFEHTTRKLDMGYWKNNVSATVWKHGLTKQCLQLDKNSLMETFVLIFLHQKWFCKNFIGLEECLHCKCYIKMSTEKNVNLTVWIL